MEPSSLPAHPPTHVSPPLNKVGLHPGESLEIAHTGDWRKRGRGWKLGSFPTVCHSPPPGPSSTLAWALPGRGAALAPDATNTKASLVQLSPAQPSLA